MRPGLDASAAFFAPFRTLFADKKIITIGGTNGKGQTCRWLDSILRSQGVSTALWTSPHYRTVRERFVQNGRNISVEELGNLYLQVAANLQTSHFTYYEFLFACFCIWVQQHGNITHLILEVGLGGRLDAVNHFHPELTAITSISRDHTEILGTRYEQIWAEKISIARPFHRLVTSFELHYLRQLTQQYCQQQHIHWHDLFAEQIVRPVANFPERNTKMAWALAALAGAHSQLPQFDDPFWQQQIPTVSMGERLEQLTIGKINFIFIGTHNLEGVRALLRLDQNYGQVLLAFSQRPQWELAAMLKLLTCHWRHWPVNLTSFNHGKALDSALAQNWGEWAQSRQKNFRWRANWKSVIDEIIQEENPQTVLATGSNYFVGEVQMYLTSHFHGICYRKL